MKIGNLKTNHHVNPLGYQLDNLYFSWEVTETDARTDRYTRIRIFSDSEAGEMVYDSGKMTEYGRPFFCPDFVPEPESRYYWQIELETDKDERQVSELAWFETALPNDKWPAMWISPEKEGEAMPCLYREFEIKAPVKRGRLYCCGLGLYEGYLNNNKVGDEFLMPGYHSYDLVKQYQTWDVTEMLIEGDNRLEFILGEGWYKGRFVFEGGYENLYGDRKILTAVLSVEYQDGRREYLCTDGTWKAEETEILSNNIYDGEVIDRARKKKKLLVEELNQPTDLVPHFNVPLRKVETYEVKEILHTPSGEVVLDFGEAITGWVEVMGKGEMDFCLQYGELMQNDELYRENLRTAKAEFRFRGEAKGEWLRPHFTYYGFRYVLVKGIQNPKAWDFVAYRIMSDLEQTGSIETSVDKINTLIDNTRRSQKCNFIDIPLDCPQRDERMGWTGDIAVFAGTGSFHMDTAAFLHHYMMNLQLEQQLLDGAVPFFVPKPKPMPHDGINPFLVTAGACTWGDAATIVPWQLYLHFGDKTMLAKHYPIMCEWVKYIDSRATQNKNPLLWQNDRQLGDWLALDNGNIHNPIGNTDMGLIASAYYYYSTVLCQRSAKVLAKTEDEAKWAAKAEQIKDAFIKEYLEESGEIKGCRTQTAYAILLYMGLYDKDRKDVLVQGLKRALQEYNHHLSTGFVGTSMLMQALSENGMVEEAYTLLLKEDYPSWLREVNMGATTIWERWNSMEDSGIISDMGMNSLNHYAYGCVAGWMYETLCGFRWDEDGSFYLEPLPDKRIHSVKGSCKLPQGICRVEWNWQEDNRCKFAIVIPFQAKVKLKLPEGEMKVLESGRYTF